MNPAARSRPLHVALTGGIATGKSYCLARFAGLGIPVVDADEVARRVVAPGTPALAAVVARFGPGVVHPSGDLDREALGRLVFADLASRKELEAIVHPVVYQKIQEWFGEQLGSACAIADIPLLYETGRERDFDRVIVVACSLAQQLERLRARGLADKEARQRVDSQLPVRKKAGRADFVIDTSGSLEATNRQVAEVAEKLKA